jgi:hypothetical protein
MAGVVTAAVDESRAAAFADLPTGVGATRGA